jgi:hypothetical protein
VVDGVRLALYPTAQLALQVVHGISQAQVVVLVAVLLCGCSFTIQRGPCFSVCRVVSCVVCGVDRFCVRTQLGAQIAQALDLLVDGHCIVLCEADACRQ